MRADEKGMVADVILVLYNTTDAIAKMDQWIIKHYKTHQCSKCFQGDIKF